MAYKKNEPVEKRAPIWVVQLVALLLLGFFVWLDATIPEFHIDKFVLFILAGAIFPAELFKRVVKMKLGNGDYDDT